MYVHMYTSVPCNWAVSCNFETTKRRQKSREVKLNDRVKDKRDIFDKIKLKNILRVNNFQTQIIRYKVIMK